jgi:threonylcarbamoyladenosine tRNA methylthiotransferase MtaB
LNKVHIETLGCKVNQYESSAIMDNLLKRGFEKAESLEVADIFILNSCTVTNRTDFKSRNMIRRFIDLKEQNPEKIIIITGCYVQREKEQAEDLGDIDALVDNNSKNTIPELIENLIKNRSIETELITPFHSISEFKDFTELPSETMNDKSRAFIKIQDGCHFYCAYCAVPFARGNPRSRRPESIIEQIKKMIESGYREFVLAGINQGLYGIDFEEKNPMANNLAELIQAICDIPEYKKIRLSSVEPQLFTEELIEVICKNDQVCPHLHIPLQSGSDTLLKAMRRRYDTLFFKNLIDTLIHRRPDIAFGFDVIVGLPGETDALFDETYRFLKEMPLTYLHTFIYSKRNGTDAAKMPNQVHGKTAKERSQKLISLSSEKTAQYIQSLINQQTSLFCVTETEDKGYFHGTSDHYVKCHFKSDQIKVNQGDLVLLKPISTSHNEVYADINEIFYQLKKDNS